MGIAEFSARSVMPVLSICVFKSNGFRNEPFLLSVCHDMSSFSFWERSTVKEFAAFGCRTVVGRTNPGDRQSVIQPKNDALDDEYVCHCRVRPDLLACAVITDIGYNGRVAFALVDKALAEFEAAVTTWESATADNSVSVAALTPLLASYQNPAEADTITRIHADLDETRSTMLIAIDKLLERGEKIEDLVDRSNDLSIASKTFSKRSAKLNRCCVIL
eukprot:c2833_g1_i1.p1 GENE.c2833_g1_i1~~c2833_g1_i1.p1  ORF type:complete len:218 (+),score=38.73 c2833_g1_i1:1-654(+)